MDDGHTRILHIVSSLDPRAGGPPAALRGLALAQHKLNLTVTVVTTHRVDRDTTIEDELQAAGIGVHSVGPVRTPLGIHRDLRTVVSEAVGQSDVVHIHGLWEDIQHQAAVACRRQGRPYIFRPCGMLDPWSLRQSRLRKHLYMVWRLRRDLNAAAVLHFTAKQERDLVKPLDLKPAVIIEPNGIDLDEFEPLPKPGLFRARCPELANRRIVLFLSRLHHKKGLDLLIPAFSQADLADTALVLAGPCDETYRHELDQQVQEAGLNGRVIFAGMQHGRERIEAFVDAELFVLPSYQENFGIVVVESLAAGTPVLISDQVNIWPEVHAAGVGRICKTEMSSVSEQLKAAFAVSEPIAAPEHCQAIVRERYNWRKIAIRWRSTYDSLTVD